VSPRGKKWPPKLGALKPLTEYLRFWDGSGHAFWPRWMLGVRAMGGKGLTLYGIGLYSICMVMQLILYLCKGMGYMVCPWYWYWFMQLVPVICFLLSIKGLLFGIVLWYWLQD